MSRLLDAETIRTRLTTLNPGWEGDTAALRRSIEFADFPTAADFVSRIVPVCEDLDHHPDLALRWRWVDIVLSTHSAGGVTATDFDLAERLDEVASALPLAD
jgi:4a-hydroxytetrahydrobiopterin dehydratase